MRQFAGTRRRDRLLQQTTSEISISIGTKKRNMFLFSSVVSALFYAYLANANHALSVRVGSHKHLFEFSNIDLNMDIVFLFLNN